MSRKVAGYSFMNKCSLQMFETVPMYREHPSIFNTFNTSYYITNNLKTDEDVDHRKYFCVIYCLFHLLSSQIEEKQNFHLSTLYLYCEVMYV